MTARGSSPDAPPRELSVFINCPFDADYAKLFARIVFATTYCGFIPRSALELLHKSRGRMDRLYATLTASRYSIHDLTRCRGEGDANLARFNMPFELGLAFGETLARAQRMQNDEREGHDWLALVPQGNLYARYISDLAGYDPSAYDSADHDSVIRKVIWWLASCEGASPPDPRVVASAFRSFDLGTLQDLRAQWESEWEIPWWTLVQAAATVARKSGAPAVSRVEAYLRARALYAPRRPRP